MKADKLMARGRTRSAHRAGWAALFLLGVIWVGGFTNTPHVESPSHRRPNIVLIMADDMGFSDIGAYGSEIDTPNLNRLAAGGLRFTQFHNTPLCSPTRAALLTGLYSHQAGLGHLAGRDFGYPAYQGYLNDQSVVTIAEVLRQGGYHTLMAGKWHLGDQRPNWPRDRGFERYFGFVGGASSYYGSGGLFPSQFILDDEPFTPRTNDFYTTDAFTDYAVTFLDEYGRRRNPFFLYVAYNAPHWPLHAWPEDIARYRGRYIEGWDVLRARRHRRMIELGLVDAAWPLTPRDEDAPAWADLTDEEKDAWDLNMAVYAAQIDRMDRGIGRILAKLRELGAEENTLILFLSDNGASAEALRFGDVPPGPRESFMSYGLPWANASNTPFRRYKHWTHEGGISAPLIARWPDKIPAGGLTHQFSHLIDIMATACDVAGVPYPRRYRGHRITPLEGKSLVPVFEGRTREGHPMLFWELEGNRAVRQGKWKLVARFQGDWELYDLEADRTELKDLADQYPEKVKELAAAYADWAQRVGVVPWEQLLPMGGAARWID